MDDVLVDGSKIDLMNGWMDRRNDILMMDGGLKMEGGRNGCMDRQTDGYKNG